MVYLLVDRKAEVVATVLWASVSGSVLGYGHGRVATLCAVGTEPCIKHNN